MPVVLTHDTIKLIKLAAKDLSSGVGSSHLSEAIAAGFGYRTNIALRQTLDEGPSLVEVSDPAFKDRLTQLGYRCTDDRLSAALQEATLRRIRAVADQLPQMTLSGINPRVGRFRATYKTEEEWADARTQLFGADMVEMFHRSEIWLAQCKKGPKIHRRQSSYGLKHSVERWIKKNIPQLHHYVANGAFIAAAVANGFEVEQIAESDLNCFINIAAKPSLYPGFTELCDHKDTYEVVAASMLGRLADVVKGWDANRKTKSPFFLTKRGLRRIQRDHAGRVRVSGGGWSVLLTFEGDLAQLSPQRIHTAILRGDLPWFMQWCDAELPYEDVP